ncbi:MAG: hypothetical protein HKN69_13415 [Desulfofustis sp.]|nr:hypothetical protein [Desulfofustis sp.]
MLLSVVTFNIFRMKERGTSWILSANIALDESPVFMVPLHPGYLPLIGVALLFSGGA